MENINILDKEKCTGCMACKSICPKKCINKEYDDLGFAYPIIDDNICIGCGLCAKCCPSLNKHNNNVTESEHVYSFINNNDIQWNHSSSGGAFAAICESYYNINSDANYYGASYNPINKSIHHIKTDFDNIKKIQKSKYVQSECDIYENIYNDLQNGYHVLFCGTPCQNAALKNFLTFKKMSLNNILMIDFICNGVGSPKTFFESISFFEKKYKLKSNKIKNVNHRGKKIGFWGSSSYYTELETDKKNIYINHNKDIHIKLYSEKINCRDSCESCVFASKHRISDITLADFKKYYYYNSNIKSNKNASFIICHTEKGNKYISNIKNKKYLIESSIDIVKLVNPQYFNGIGTKDKNKRTLLKQYYKNNDTFINNLPKYLFKKKSIKIFLANFLPDTFREKLEYIIKKGK